LKSRKLYLQSGMIETERRSPSAFARKKVLRHRLHIKYAESLHNTAFLARSSADNSQRKLLGRVQISTSLMVFDKRAISVFNYMTCSHYERGRMIYRMTERPMQWCSVDNKGLGTHPKYSHLKTALKSL